MHFYSSIGLKLFYRVIERITKYQSRAFHFKQLLLTQHERRKAKAPE